MDDKKQIVISMNGKKTKLIRKNSIDGKPGSDSRELAATLDHSKENKQIPAYERQHERDPVKKDYVRKWGKLRMYKPILIAIVSAIVIGVGMGFIMLNMFAGIDEDANPGNGSVSSAFTDEANDRAPDKSTASENVTLDSIQAFVTQGGVYTSENNARDEAKTYQDAGFATMIWEREGNFFLLAGIADSEELAKNVATKLDENQLEAYVKRWSTIETEKQLDEMEQKWLQAFTEFWQESLKKASNKEAISVSAWNGLLDAYPEQASNLSNFLENLKQISKQIEASDEQKAQIILLELWREYEAFLDT